MRLSQSEIGTLVAATREAVNKQLRYWRDEGVLDLVGGQIVLLRTDVLLNLVE
jgi:CRP-like cAMP-binding protein